MTGRFNPLRGAGDHLGPVRPAPGDWVQPERRMGGSRVLGLFLFRLFGFAVPRCCLLGGLRAAGVRYGMSLGPAYKVA